MEILEALKIKMEVLDQILNDIDCIIEKNEVKKQSEHNSLCKLLDKLFKERAELNQTIQKLQKEIR